MINRTQIFDTYTIAREAVRRNGKKGVVAFVALAVVALVGALVMPRTYVSEARLFVRFGRENQVDPTASGGQMVSLYESRESEINSLIEILRSRAVLDRVVEELGLGGSGDSGLGARDLEEKVQSSKFKVQGQAEESGDGGEREYPHPAAAPPPSPKGRGIYVTGKAHQVAVRKLAKDMTIAAPRKSNIITVSCKAKSPELAQKIVAKLVEVYQEEHVRVHRSPGTYAFFAGQEKESLAAWEKAADELRETKNSLGIVTIEGRRKHLDDTIADIDSKRLANEAERKKTAATIESLEAQIANMPATLITQETTAASAAADGMRQSLYNLETQEQELSTKMQDSHPRLTAIRKQVAELRSILDEQPGQNVNATEAINPSRQSLELALLNERSQADALAATDRALAGQQLTLRGQMMELNAQSLAIDELTQRVALAENNHKEYAQRLEQARINRTLDDERISSLSLVQPASYVATASGPGRTVVLALGLFVALGSGLFAIAAATWMNPLIRSADELVEALQLPVIGIVPRRVMASA
ncbi:MAG TPA: hypothetical protein VGI40_26490 [Pirellulaceae bacterium]|jgi:uncharacterized protein involved in exopolysaccharide biosynthesis